MKPDTCRHIGNAFVHRCVECRKCGDYACNNCGGAYMFTRKSDNKTICGRCTEPKFLAPKDGR